MLVDELAVHVDGPRELVAEGGHERRVGGDREIDVSEEERSVYVDDEPRHPIGGRELDRVELEEDRRREGEVSREGELLEGALDVGGAEDEHRAAISAGRRIQSAELEGSLGREVDGDRARELRGRAMRGVVGL